MLAVRLHEEGPPDLLRVEEVPDPPVPSGTVRVRLRAASLNRLDVWCRLGRPSVARPRILGADGAGTVDAVGVGVTGVARGDRVCLDPTLSCDACASCYAGRQTLCERFAVLGEHRDGTHAQLVTVPARNVHAVPPGLSDVEAGAFGLVMTTAYRLLHTRAAVRAEETVLIWGIGGGVATAALSIARAAGARTIVTSSRDAKLDRARDLGADVTVNHARDDVVAAVRDATGGRGADVVVETVGDATWQRSVAATARGGRIAVCGATSGPNPPARLHQVFYRQISVLGSTMGSDADFRAVLALLAARRIWPVVDSTVPLERAADAHRRLEAGEQLGKIVLETA
jgi:NADPH:quinone reductase-like Zn-dependent oxidoreductase